MQKDSMFSTIYEKHGIREINNAHINTEYFHNTIIKTYLIKNKIFKQEIISKSNQSKIVYEFYNNMNILSTTIYDDYGQIAERSNFDLFGKLLRKYYYKHSKITFEVFYYENKQIENYYIDGIKNKTIIKCKDKIFIKNFI